MPRQPHPTSIRLAMEAAQAKWLADRILSPFASPGRAAYEAECAAHPLYHNHTARPAWDALKPDAQADWEVLARPEGRNTADPIPAPPSRGRDAYEAACARWPSRQDVSPRPSWHMLGANARAQWEIVARGTE